MSSFGDMFSKVGTSVEKMVAIMALSPEEQAAREARILADPRDFGGGLVSTPQWMKDIGDSIRPLAQVAGAVAIGGVLGKIIGGTTASPTVAAGEASVAAQQKHPGDADVGKVSTGAATILGMQFQKSTLLLMAIGIGVSLLFLKGR